MEHQQNDDVVDDDTPGAENDPIGLMKETAEDPSSKTASKRRKRMIRLKRQAVAAASRQPQQQQQPQQQLHPAPVAFPAQWQQFRGTQPHFNMDAPIGMPAPGVPHGQPMHWPWQSMIIPYFDRF